MQSDKKILLSEIYQKLLDEKKVFEDKINKNLMRIAEIDIYLKSIYDREVSDFKVFSPRSVESVYKEQIERNKLEKYSIENENQYQYRQINRITDYLEKLEQILKSEDTEIPVLSNIDKQELNKKILDIQEKERQRIARDLHDTSLQNLAHVVHMIELSSMYIDKDIIKAKLELASVNKNLKAIIEDIRNTIFDLRPMSYDDLGFKETLENLFDKLEESSKIYIHYDIDEINGNDKTIIMTLFRVIKECCYNAINHSGCNELDVKLKKQQNDLVIEIKDDGIGFDVDEVVSTRKNHFGLHIMKERVELLGGKFSIQSVINDGTAVKMVIPISTIGGC